MGKGYIFGGLCLCFAFLEHLASSHEIKKLQKARQGLVDLINQMEADEEEEKENVFEEE